MQKYNKYFDCANILTKKVFNNYAKFSKIKSQATNNKQLAIFKKLKSFPK